MRYSDEELTALDFEWHNGFACGALVMLLLVALLCIAVANRTPPKKPQQVSAILCNTPKLPSLRGDRS